MSKTDLRKFIRGVLSESLQVIDKDDQDSPTFITYYMPLEEDRFIHFTSEVRANQILETGKLEKPIPINSLLKIPIVDLLSAFLIVSWDGRTSFSTVLPKSSSSFKVLKIYSAISF